MASIPEYFYDYAFSNEWCQESLPFIDYGGLEMVQPENQVMPSLSFPERFGVSGMAVPSMPEFSLGLCENMSGTQSFSSCSSKQDLCHEFNKAFDDHSVVIYPPNCNNWGIQDKQVVQPIEEPTMKVGKYSTEERKDRIVRYLKKRNQRNFNKTIKYACRKTLADKRVRIRGRFARNNEKYCQEELVTMNNNNIPHEEREYYDDYAVKIKVDEDHWPEYLSYIAG